MNLILRPRGSGKTKELIKFALDNNCSILAFTPSKVNSLKEKSLVYFGQAVPVILYPEPCSGSVVVDDVEEVLPQLIKLIYPEATLEGFAQSTD